MCAAWNEAGRACRLALLSLALTAALAGCGDTPKDQLSGSLGNGSGGPALSGTPATLPLTKPSGEQIGQVQYDPAYFVPAPATGDSTTEAVLANLTDQVLVTLVRFSGARADTPCRFQAATLARDENYDIGDFGTRTNSLGQEMYQVNVAKPGSAQTLYCALLRDNSGVLVDVTATGPAQLGWLQVLYVINSIQVR